MLMPFGAMGGGMGLGGEMMYVAAPPVVKDFYAKFWWLLFVILAGVCVCEVVALEIFDAIFAAILTLIVWHMVREKCAQMSPHCLIIFGVICAIQAIFEVLSLVSSVKGRRISHTMRIPVDASKMTLTTTVEMHPFFDPTQGMLYNMQSVVKILSPSAMVLGTLLTYTSYKAFPTMDEEMAPVMERDGRGDLYGGAGAGAGAGGNDGRPGNAGRQQYFGAAGNGFGNAGRNRAGGQSFAFQGNAHRLGGPLNDPPERQPQASGGVDVPSHGAPSQGAPQRTPQAPQAPSVPPSPPATPAPLQAPGAPAREPVVFQGSGQRLGST